MKYYIIIYNIILCMFPTETYAEQSTLLYITLVVTIVIIPIMPSLSLSLLQLLLLEQFQLLLLDSCQ